MSDNIETKEVHQTTHSSSNPLFAPDIEMMVLTWLTFFALLAILTKYAWKPILKILDDREENIRHAVEEAEKTREEYQQLAQKRREILTEADNSAKEFINQSRQTALKAAKVIEERVAEDAVIMVENAKREIDAEKEKAAVYLREKSADIAVQLASKMLTEKLNPQTHSAIINQLIDEI